MTRRTFASLAFAAIGMSFGLASTALAADATGTYTWTVERNGNTITTTLKLKQDGTKLTGTVSGRNNTETEIEDGKVEGDVVSFKVTREFNGNKFVANYSGKLSGDTIKGESKVERDGQTQTRPWEAKKS